MKTILSLTLVLLLLSIFPIHGHVIGHKASGFQAGRTWSLSDGTMVKGNFSHMNSDLVVIETPDGRLRSFQVKDLSENDRRIISIKIEKLNELNRLNSRYHTPATNKRSSKWLVMAAAMMVAMILVITLRRRSSFNWLNSTLAVFIFMVGLLVACSDDGSPSTSGNFIPKTSTSFLTAAFSRFAPAVTTSWDDQYFHISSDGLPAHGMMIGITNWQQQVPVAQSYSGSNSWSIPLQPVFAAAPLDTRTHLMKGAVALAVNGIPIFNALNNRGEDSFAIGELDQWGGHCGKADDYHYHAAPLHLASSDPALPIAFALDGFPVYGPVEPDGSTMMPLDGGHGHAWGQQAYHYHGTSSYPYVIGMMRGKVGLDPATPAPEDQILPQAFAKPLRPATTPLKGAVITAYESIGERSRRLVYRIGSKNGSVEYSWDLSGKYTFIMTDTAGMAVVQVYQR